jgi:uncharacterized protein YlaN (UPF0358 family)
MANLSERKKALHTADIVHHGEQLIVPEAMPLRSAIKLLERREEYEEERTTYNETFEVFPWDGANALAHVLTNLYGWAPVKAPSMFEAPPQLIAIEVAYGKRGNVPWGKFELPNLDRAVVQCSTNYNNAGQICFALAASAKRKDEAAIMQLFAAVREYLAHNSLYQGKAVRLRFKDDQGNKLEMPAINFMDTDIDESMLIYSKDVEDAVRTNLFVPIERVADCRTNGIAVKRGVLLGGTFGTGKTLAAKVASKKAVENGVTFIYAPRADELAETIAFARQYQNPACVVFCEDIDRQMAGDSRTVEMDDLLNTIDGIDSKSSNIIVVLSSNNLQAINPAILRPGRLDAVIEVTPPDAEAVTRLVRAYAGSLLPANEKLIEVGKALQGQIPAVIAEVVKRAKLAQMGLQPAGTTVEQISAKALLISASTITRQVELLNRENKEPTQAEKLQTAMQATVRNAFNGHMEQITETHKLTHDLHNRFC